LGYHVITFSWAAYLYFYLIWDCYGCQTQEIIQLYLRLTTECLTENGLWVENHNSGAL
jgi:hypothetical protein